MTTSETKTWGFLHPECHGRNALMFFSWDLARTIEEQFTLHASAPIDIRVYEAQKAVNRLLNQYVQIQANPKAFEGQSITLHIEHDESEPDKSVLALHTTAHLEQLILEVQEEQANQRIN
ncbi:hypothetical protein ACMHYO_16460 [Allopusillimonas ginsengisoli]|uniref:hypothetical protein n=1 Tax=Allopusillimonas ginsengisoli TaxID=453575 RepID=UPI0010C185BE|nr:hypothetical protein D7I39_11210 [Allopusillimonas ginsengisoli]